MLLKITILRSGFTLLMSATLLAGCSTSKPAMDDCDCCAVPSTKPAAATQPAATTKPANEAAWTDLFDGKSLKNWKAANYAGAKDPEVEEGVLIIPAGETLSGATWIGHELPRTNYELQWVAKRIDGVDFFCGVTFPVNKTYATFVTGGWGGAVVGISCIDSEDAAHNETTVYEKFEKGKFYTFKVRVEPEQITGWIDGKQVIDVNIKGKEVNIRGDIDQSTPLGLSSFATTGGVKSVQIRTLK